MNEENEFNDNWEDALEAFEEEYQDDETEVSDEETEQDEQQDEDEQEDEVDLEEEEGSEDSSNEDSEDTEPEFKDEKQKNAFQEMRKKLQQAEKQANETSKYAKLIEKIAEQNGTSPDKIVEEYERRQLEKEAEDNNLPVEYLQKQKQLEDELKQMKQQTFTKEFRQQADELKSKYSLDQDAVNEVAKFMDEKGFPLDFDLEIAYKVMNLDNIIEKQVKEANQQRLANKQSKRRSAAIPQGDASASQNNPNVLSDEEYHAMMKELDIGQN